MKMEILLEPTSNKLLVGSYALSWKPCQGDSLNLPDHRYNAGVAVSFQRSQNSYYQAFNVKSLFEEIDCPKKSQVKLKCQIKVIHVRGDLTALKCHIKAHNQESQSMNN
nr:hypothetical protein [Tanacetum cinerariifolium]